MSDSLVHAVHSEIIVKKSRFIGCVQPVQDRADALAIVRALRSEHPGANHVCWALMTTHDCSANDDGEPGGTAGKPMLNVLRHQNLQNVLATVVRYFGGIKLGAGGLVRAYTDAIAQPLIDAPRSPVQQRVLMQALVSYANEGMVRRLIEQAGASIAKATHTAQVALVIDCTAAQAQALNTSIISVTQGQSSLQAL